MHYIKNKTKNSSGGTGRVSRVSAGMSLIEVVVGSAIIIASLASIIGAYGGLTGLSLRNTPKVQAAMLLDEGAEVLKVLRDTGWTSKIAPLATGGTAYRLVWQNNAWAATTSVAMIDNFFDRTVRFYTVNRDATSYDVVTSGGTLDTGTRRAVVSVAWRDGTATTTRSIELFLYNTFSN